MSEKRWTQEEVDAITNEVRNLEGLSDEEITKGKATIEEKYGLSPGTLTAGEKVKATLPGATGKKVGTFEATNYWPYFRPVAKEKEKIPEVFGFSEALRRNSDPSPNVRAKAEKERVEKPKTAREIYTENFQRDQASKKQA